ncbi:MAG: hypothetical protein ACREO9_04555, partial [Lysobacterales bacterium]
MQRRPLIATLVAGAGTAFLPGCGRERARADKPGREIEMRWVGAAHERGHLLRDAVTAAAVRSAWP